MDGSQEPDNHVEEENSTISDTESVASPQAGSDVSVDEVPDSRAEPDVEVIEPRLTPAIRAAFAELDGFDLRAEFNKRASVMKTVPHFLRGSYRSAMRLAMEEATHPNVARQERGWRLFLLLPRLLLHRPPRGGNIEKRKLARRFEFLAEGSWISLLQASRQSAEASSTAQARKRRRDTQQDEFERHTQRAHTLIQLCELSAGRQLF